MNVIVAVDRHWAIGRENELLFSLPTDMKRFRALTTGGTVILGRKTLDSFPHGRPLPKRRNIVITRDPSFSREGAEIVHSPQEALERAGADEGVWLIGGSSIYKALLGRCERAYVTKVDAAAEGADAFFPDLDALPNWQLESVSETIEENGLRYCFAAYINTELTPTT